MEKSIQFYGVDSLSCLYYFEAMGMTLEVPAGLD